MDRGAYLPLPRPDLGFGSVVSSAAGAAGAVAGAAAEARHKQLDASKLIFGTMIVRGMRRKRKTRRYEAKRLDGITWKQKRPLEGRKDTRRGSDVGDVMLSVEMAREACNLRICHCIEFAGLDWTCPKSIFRVGPGRFPLATLSLDHLRAGSL